MKGFSEMKFLAASRAKEAREDVQSSRIICFGLPALNKPKMSNYTIFWHHENSVFKGLQCFASHKTHTIPPKISSILI